jgi:hypothetical protein
MVREAKLQDRAEFARLWHAALVEEHAGGSDMLPTGRSVAFGLNYFDSYVRGSRFGVCLLWSPPGEAPSGFVLAGERWDGDDYDRPWGRMAWLWNIYVAPEARCGPASRQLLAAGYRALGEMGFETIGFNIPEGCPSGPIAQRWRAVPRGKWYTVDVRPRRPRPAGQRGPTCG